MSKTPSMLSFVRSINPGHMLMYSAAEVGTSVSKLTPLGVRDEPLRGLNATMKSKEEEKAQAVLQVVESAQLAAGDSVLVLLGKVLIRNQVAVPHSCNEKEFFGEHLAVVNAAKEAGDFAELARRYALTMGMGGWAWRNALEAEELTVTVSWGAGVDKQEVSFTDLMPAAVGMFEYDSPEYENHKGSLQILANAIEQALSSDAHRGVNFSLRADIRMGVGARVYPSQEWSSTEMQKASVENWKGGKGVTRTLAKLKTPDGRTQAILNDRKVGNALRTIDTWYPKAAPDSPIAVEPYGGNSHKSVAFRSAASASVFGAVAAIAKGETLSREQRLFYIAACIRGGVFGGAED